MVEKLAVLEANFELGLSDMIMESYSQIAIQAIIVIVKVSIQICNIIMGIIVLASTTN